MKIRLQEGLPYITATLTYRGQQLALDKVILDTGSTGTIFSADRVLAMGLLPEPLDTLHRVWGVRGAEFVFTKRLDQLAVGELAVSDFEIEVGAMEYEIELDGIVGLDFMMHAGAVIDLARMEVRR
jgi:hypothetical protein